ncbi:HAD-IB family hydrolase [Actinomyces sp. zg-332]|uniref:HAD family hydrolase n=1 Tax=Actinomyces sp. zg-332 TaxID=2708340 RepID=UPI001420DB95|nr:HAD-IB family hydrolase [Actinomyces sp. zg-332]QPK94040.1 HAD-IB family hydrolase [Actinomyces sp. zg-332]
MNMNINQPNTDSSANSRVVAFFDIDQTLIRGSSSYYVARELYRRNFFGWRDIFFAARHSLLYMLFGESKRRLDLVADRALNVLAGRSVDEVSKIVEELYDNDLHGRIFVYMREVLNRHLVAGHDVWLVSAVPVQIGAVIAKKLGVNGILGTKVKVVDGVLAPELDGELMHNEGKGLAVSKVASEYEYDLTNSFAYGDSYGDIPMLSMVGFPCGVNPDRKLRRVCESKGWNILRVKRTFNG